MLLQQCQSNHTGSGRICFNLQGSGLVSLRERYGNLEMLSLSLYIFSDKSDVRGNGERLIYLSRPKYSKSLVPSLKVSLSGWFGHGRKKDFSSQAFESPNTLSMLLKSSRLFTLLCSELKVPVQMWIGHPDTPFEHWVLNIDKSNNFHTKKVSRNPKHPLKPSLYSKDYSSVNDPDWQYIDLDCEATFNSDSKMEDVFKDLVNIPWTSAPIDSGGNCLDYVKAALELLAEGNFISAVPSKFTDRYNKYYVEVTKTVWKVEVTLPQS
ncbi:hypothetical protein C8J55DRAFT_591517 [Lentinula edodes]|uniref:Uncharacterized protein n=1 Tax=Lentinula lateritia TaxID=40482 RepID=A0A9W9AVX6_9AGAR|nr:hypothetical protein C8J55DRAFT_591517 [Lentinula edodes]